MTKGDAKPLDVALVVSDRTALEAGAWRLAAHLHRDPRYRLAAIVSRPQPITLTDWWMALEARAFLRTRFASDPEVKAAVLSVPDQIADVDVVVDLTGAAADLAALARHGVWQLSSSAPDAGLAALARGATEIWVTLTQDCGAGAQPIAEARYGTKVAASRTRAYLREKSVQMVWHALARLAQGAPFDPITPTPEPPRAKALYPFRLAATLARRGAMTVEERLGGTPGQFVLMLGPGDPLDVDPATLTEVTAPKGQFWADPFLYQDGADFWLFYEDYRAATGLGQISVARVDGTEVTPVGTALSAPHHLSYPFVFAHEGAIFMMPETHQTGRLEIWRATSFPLEWTLHATALEGQGPADSALLHLDETWWLFTNLCHDRFGDYSTELHLFRTSGLDLAWVEPHPLNPVVIDAGTARGGGRAFVRDGRIYRVSQDNTGRLYGFGINLMEITRLDRSGYAERRVRHITPDFQPGLIGCHHMDFAGGQVVIDARRRR